MYDILLKTPLAHVYNYFWWTVKLLELVWKQEINLPICSPYKVDLFFLQIVVSWEALNVSWQFNVPVIECTEVRCQQIDL